MGKVREDKRREATDGHDGTWVAHPGLVPIATEEFDTVLGKKPNQIDRLRDDVNVTPEQLLEVPQGTITEEGLRNNIRVGIQYLEAWLGVGRVRRRHDGRQSRPLRDRRVKDPEHDKYARHANHGRGHSCGDYDATTAPVELRHHLIYTARPASVPGRRPPELIRRLFTGPSQVEPKIKAR